MAQYLNIDTTDKTDLITKVILDSVLYIFRLRYSYRSGWQLGIYDSSLYQYDATDNTPAKLYGDRNLVPNQNYLKYVKTTDSLPHGYLAVVDTEEGADVESVLPSRYDLGLGKRFVFVYFTEDEIAEYTGDN